MPVMEDLLLADGKEVKLAGVPAGDVPNREAGDPFPGVFGFTHHLQLTSRDLPDRAGTRSLLSAGRPSSIGQR